MSVLVIYTHAPLLAQSKAATDGFPLIYQIACIILTALFLLSFSVARNPRSWRRLYQAKLSKKEDISVNKNKKLDEQLKKYGIIIAMIFLVLGVTLFVTGVTQEYRDRQRKKSKDLEMQKIDAQQFKSGEAPGSSRLFR